MKLLIVDPDEARRARVVEGLRASQDFDIRVCDDTPGVLSHVSSFQPDIIIVACETPARDAIEDLRRVTECNPRPIVMFADRANPAQTEEALRAGVAAYTTDGLEPSQIHGILAFASAQFRVMQALKRDLHQARADLAARKVIDRAKGLIMKRRGVDEAAAYAILRQAAMDQGRSIAVVASRLVEAEALLGDNAS
jgi:two-component system, response regulator / RNA-binding antiterminator